MKKMSKQTPSHATKGQQEVGVSETNGSDDDQRLLLNVNGLGVPTWERPFIVEYFPTPIQAQAERRVRGRELDEQEKIARSALRQIRREWKQKLKESGQMAVFNVAYRTKLGQIVAPLQYVIRIDVEQKLPPNAIEDKEWFEFPSVVLVTIRNKTYQVPTKVRQIRVSAGVGTVSKKAGVSPGSFPTEPEIKGGIAISSPAVPGEFGTLGICIPNGANLVGITNYHVTGALENPHQSILNPPGNLASVIGTLTDSVMGNLIDGAYFDGVGARHFQEGIKGLPYPGADIVFLKDTDLGADKFKDLEHAIVIKYGAASSRTTGSIMSRLIDSPPVDDLDPTIFNRVIEVHSDHLFLDNGDSGSVILYEDMSGGSLVPVVLGLNFVAETGGRTAYAIPFGRVIRAFNLKLPAARMWRP